MTRWTKALGTSWQTGYASGTNSPADVTWSVAYTSNPGITSGDHLIMGGVTPSDVATTWSASAVTATGATISAGTSVGNPRVTTGNDLGGHIDRTTCTAGTATGNPTWTQTLSVGTNQDGSGVIVRLREVTPAARVPSPYIVGREAIRRSSEW